MANNRETSEKDSREFSLQNHNLFCVKFAALFFFLGLAFRLLFWDSFSLSSFVEFQKPLPQTVSPVVSSPKSSPESDASQLNNNQNPASLNGNKLYIFLCFFL